MALFPGHVSNKMNFEPSTHDLSEPFHDSVSLLRADLTEFCLKHIKILSVLRTYRRGFLSEG